LGSHEIDVTSRTAHRPTADYARKAAPGFAYHCRRGRRGASGWREPAHTTLPVIGVPIPSTSLQGMISLAIVQMRPHSVRQCDRKAGATNAGSAQHDRRAD